MFKSGIRTGLFFLLASTLAPGLATAQSQAPASLLGLTTLELGPNGGGGAQDDLLFARSHPGHTAASIKPALNSTAAASSSVSATIPQVSPQRVTLDITEHGHQMLVVLDWEGFETALPDMACRVVMAMVPAGMRREQPLHPAAEITIGNRSDHQVKMVRHQTIAQQVDGQSCACVNRCLHEGTETAGL